MAQCILLAEMNAIKSVWCFVFFHLALVLSQADGRVNMIATPVVFTNSAGGGLDEVQAPAGAEGSKLFDAGGQVVAAWWVPYDNLGDLPAIHMIETVPAGSHVNLVVKGRRGQRNARVRIKIYAEMLTNESCG